MDPLLTTEECPVFCGSDVVDTEHKVTQINSRCIGQGLGRDTQMRRIGGWHISKGTNDSEVGVRREPLGPVQDLGLPPALLTPPVGSQVPGWGESL